MKEIVEDEVVVDEDSDYNDNLEEENENEITKRTILEKNNGQTAKNDVVPDTKSNVQPI